MLLVVLTEAWWCFCEVWLGTTIHSALLYLLASAIDCMLCSALLFLLASAIVLLHALPPGSALGVIFLYRLSARLIRQCWCF